MRSMSPNNARRIPPRGSAQGRLEDNMAERSAFSSGAARLRLLALVLRRAEAGPRWIEDKISASKEARALLETRAGMSGEVWPNLVLWLRRALTDAYLATDNPTIRLGRAVPPERADDAIRWFATATLAREVGGLSQGAYETLTGPWIRAIGTADLEDEVPA